LRPEEQKKATKELSEILRERKIDFGDLRRERDDLYERWIKDAVAASKGNIAQAAEIRSRYLQS
jgi:hypothetical protein